MSNVFFNEIYWKTQHNIMNQLRHTEEKYIQIPKSVS